MGRQDSAFDRVLHAVGSAVVAGDLPAGHVTSVDRLSEHTAASRSVVREAVRVLISLGLLTASPRVGLVVRPSTAWDVLDPQVIRWRLRGPDRAAQLAELRQLRAALEPAAAAAAATAVRDARDPTAGTQRLLAAAQHLDAVALTAGGGAFLRADEELHSAVLDLSGNATFLRLGTVVAEALRERALFERADVPPEPHDVALHRTLAEAICRGDAPTASAAMREIVERTAAPPAHTPTAARGSTAGGQGASGAAPGRR